MKIISLKIINKKGLFKFLYTLAKKSNFVNYFGRVLIFVSLSKYCDHFQFVVHIYFSENIQFDVMESSNGIVS